MTDTVDLAPHKIRSQKFIQSLKNSPTQQQPLKLKIALFCGGRGSASIIHELLSWPNLQLSLIVNAYDDGLSTGALRHYVSQMLGPSDFRKNLSYLLDPYSKSQYALKNVLEFRLPNTPQAPEIAELQRYSQQKNLEALTSPLRQTFASIAPQQAITICDLLDTFFRYAEQNPLAFNYQDCSLGNLIFAGAYLQNNHNFNAAANQISQLVHSRALLINVSKGENRILVGLKEDGELLASEADIVSSQTPTPIHRLFLVKEPIDIALWKTWQPANLAEKVAWLREQESLPEISPEAEKALTEADIIIFGPGTQHSSLFPSYRIAQKQLQQASAPIKALIMNLDADHDIQSLTSQQVLDFALQYAGDPLNHQQTITHVLLDKHCSLPPGQLAGKKTYKKCHVIRDAWANPFKKHLHNGSAVFEKVSSLWESTLAIQQNNTQTASLFVDLHSRYLGIHELYDEFLEINWKQLFKQVDLIIHASKPNPDQPTLPTAESDFITLKHWQCDGDFPEVTCFFNWLEQEQSEYLILLTGDGKYCFRDVILGIKLLEQSHFSAVFGSRNQSRRQFKNSLRAAYGEKKILRTCSFLGSFLISALFALRFGVVFSDPLTGFRIFKRSRLCAMDVSIKKQPRRRIHNLISLTSFLIRNDQEIAELPVTYRTFSGFVDPHWRFRRGLKNLYTTCHTFLGRVQ